MGKAMHQERELWEIKLQGEAEAAWVRPWRLGGYDGLNGGPPKDMPMS